VDEVESFSTVGNGRRSSRLVWVGKKAGFVWEWAVLILCLHDSPQFVGGVVSCMEMETNRAVDRRWVNS